MAKTDKADKTEIAEIKAALAEVVQELKSDRDAPGQVGRTPSDAVTEVTGNLFRLLGQWTTPILLLVLLAVGWYFLQEQNQKVDTEYKDALAVLREERDGAYDRISEFNREMAEVSGQQIKNLTDAFDSLRKINTESAMRQTEAFQYQEEAEEAIDQLAGAKAELASATSELDQQREALAVSQKRLEEAEEELGKREREVARKERDLGQRGGTIGELQDVLRDYQELTDRYVGLLSRQSDVLRGDDPDPLALASVADEIDGLRGQYSDVTQRVQDTVADPAAILAPLADLSGDLFLSPDIEPIIGLSVARFAEHITENNGFGFNFWRRYSADGDEAIIGAALGSEGLLRLIILETETGADGSDRIVTTDSVAMVLPVIGPDYDDAWQTAIYVSDLAPGRISIDNLAFSGPDDTNQVSLTAMFGLVGEIESLQFLHGDTDVIPVLTDAQFQNLLQSNQLPFDIKLELNSKEGLAPVFNMISEKAGGATSWRDALAGVSDPELRTKSAALLELARQGIYRDGNVDVPTNVFRSDLGAIASYLLQPAFRMSSAINPREFELNIAPKEQSEPVGPITPITDEKWSQTADVMLRADNGRELGIRFMRDSGDEEWRIEEVSSW